MLVGTRQAAAIIGVPITSLWNWLQLHPEIDRQRIGNSVVVTLEDVEQYRLIHRPQKVTRNSKG